MPQRHRDAEKRRRRDGETESRRDGEKMRSHLAASPTLCLSFSLSLFLSVALWLCGSVASSTQTDSFEKQALSLVREMPASALDAELPGRSFASWFEQVTGPKAGVIWQLTECGEQMVAPDQTGQDLPPSPEVNPTLPHARNSFVP